MHSFIVQQLNVPDSTDTLKIIPDKSIGIEEVRKITQFLSKKPTLGGNNTVIIHDAHLLTLPAQNAILKILEEPPASSVIYLLTASPNQLIPTILSRCQLLKPDSPAPVPDLTQSQELLDKLLESKPGDRLKILDDQEFDRSTALKFLDNLEFIIHNNLSRSNLYPIVSQTKIYLKSNCSVKLSLDYLAINL